MYIRTKTFKNKDGSTRTYLYIVEGKRVNGKVRQRIVANLGRLEKLQEGQLDKLIEGLVGYRRYLKVKGSAVEMRGQEGCWRLERGKVLWNVGIVCLETIDTRDFFVRGVKVGLEVVGNGFYL